MKHTYVCVHFYGQDVGSDRPISAGVRPLLGIELTEYRASPPVNG